MATQRSKRLYALLFSFSVYLLPLIGPHTVSFLGKIVWRDLTRREHEPLWIAMDAGFAMVLQFVAFAILSWVFKTPTKIRFTALAVAVPFAVGLAEYVYLVQIPSRFLIEQDEAEEKGDWARECAAPEVGLIEIAHPTRSVVWSEIPVQASDGSYQLMRIPGCELTPLALPRSKLYPGGRVDFIISPTYFVPGHGVIFSKQETETGVFTWNHFFNDRITPIPGLQPVAAPILSLDGDWAAWLEKDSLAIERLDGNESPLQVGLDNFNASSFTLGMVDMQGGEIELRSSDRRVVLDLTGSIKQSENLPLAWDVYRDVGPYRVSWDIGGRSGTHNVLKGRSINSAALSPSGDLIAVSVASALNIGQIRDSLYVLRANDGTEIFRRYLPMYTRTPVLFPTDDSLVYSADRQVIVVRVRR